MEPLPLRLVGWIFTAAGMFALVSGVMALRTLHKAGMLPPKSGHYSVWNDIFLMGIWSMSLFAGLGVVNYRGWALTLLEYFCWVLIVLSGMSAWSRALTMRDQFMKQYPDGEFVWTPVVTGVLLFFIPVTLFCGYTIYTVRDEGVRTEYRDAVKQIDAERARRAR